MDYNIIIVGGGPGGYVAAIRGAQMGAKVALVEEKALGGVCLNCGCIPTKALLKSAMVLQEIKDAARFGINIGSVSVDFNRIMKRKNEVVSTLSSGIKGLMSANGIDVIKGRAELEAYDTVNIQGKRLKGSSIIIATGSVPFKPPIPGIDRSCVITSDEALELTKLPKSMVVIGGGVIGVEMATLFGLLGCEVTIIEMMDRIVPMMESEISEELCSILKKSSISVITSARVKEIHDGSVTYSKGNATQNVKAEKVLLASGRLSSGEKLSLDKLGIRHKKGVIETDEKMRTNIENIYAIGDVNGKYMLAHTASEEGIVAVENIMGLTKTMDYNSIPQCIYTSPEIASVGITEEQARSKGYKVRVSKFPLMANGKALTEGYTDGFIKMIADEAYGQILGVHIMASHATEIISQCAIAMHNELTVYELANTIFPHPTQSEIIPEASRGFSHGAVHISTKKR